MAKPHPASYEARSASTNPQLAAQFARCLLVTLAAAVGWVAVRLEQWMFPLGEAGPLGIWPVDVYIGLAVLLAGVTLWAIYAVVALLRAAARYGG